MNKQNPTQQSSKINRSVYSLLGLLIAIFVLLIVMLQLQGNENFRKSELANNYHLASSAKAMQLLLLTVDAKLWFQQFEIKHKSKNVTSENKLPVSPISIELSARDQINSFKAEMAALTFQVITIQKQYADPEFNTIVSILDAVDLKVFDRLEELLATGNYSSHKINEIVAPLSAVSHQLQRLHKVAHQNIYSLINNSKMENRIKIFFLVFSLMVIGLFGIVRGMRHVRSALNELTTAQNEIEQGGARFEAMFESISDAIVYADRNRKIRLVNNATIQMFGYEASELVGNETKMLYASSDEFEHQGRKRFNHDASLKQAPYQLTYRCKNGDVFQGETIGTPVKSVTGETIGFIGVIRDVSERTHVDAILRSLASGASGLKFEQFMADVLERLTELYGCEYAFIGSLQPDGAHVQTLAVRANGEMADNFEYSLNGTPCKDILDRKKELIPKEASLIYSDDQMLVGMEVESYFGAPLIASDDSIIGILSMMGTQPMELDEWTEPVLGVFATRVALELERNNTARELQQHREHLEVMVQKRTVDLRTARDEAEKANKAKSEFLSSMSHELRTPMNAVLGFAQLLELDADKLDETQHENVKEILDAGHHLLDLINDVLDLAKIESGKLGVSMEEIHVDDMLQQCVTLIDAQMKTRHITLVDNVSGNDYIVKADFTRFKQVMINLLSNAIKYNSEQGRITLDSKNIDNQRLRISVTDTGDGLSEDEMAKLFTSFERLNVKYNVEGTGIGLVITRHLVELMGGSVGVESTPGKGSTFWVELALSSMA